MREQITAANAANLKSIGSIKTGWITQVIWSPDGMTIGVAGASGVRLFVGKFGGEPTHILDGQEGHIKGAAFSADGGLLASVASDTTVRLWDLQDIHNQVGHLGDLQGHSDSIDAVAFHPAGDTLATCSADHTIRLWNLATGQQKAVLKGHEGEVSTIAYGLGGNVVISGSWDTSVRMWDAGGETHGTVIGYHDDWVRQVATNPPGTMIASASKDMSVRLWDAHSGEAYATINAHIGGADCVAFSPDGALIATGGRDNVVRLWDTHDVLAMRRAGPGDALAELHGHEKPIMSLIFNPAGKLLATGSGDNSVRLWSAD